MFTYSLANTPLSQSECAYYLSYFIIIDRTEKFGKKGIYYQILLYGQEENLLNTYFAAGARTSDLPMPT